MCELFGVSSRKRVDCGCLLREFFSHAKENPHGWGISFFSSKEELFLKKEPVSAAQSSYLKNLFLSPVEEKLLLAHIRLATKGGVEYKNTHPFVNKDASGRTWILEHNGTVFESEELSAYIHHQDGDTDSERILCYLIDRMNAKIGEKGRLLSEEERSELVEEILVRIAPENKLNLLLSDGELLYVHTNYKKSLHICETEDSVFFATKPLDEKVWEELPLNRLLVFKENALIYKGKKHAYEFFDDPEKLKYLYLDFAGM